MGHLKILNARKEEIYNRDDIAEFEQMSPIKKLVQQSLIPSAEHTSNIRSEVNTEYKLQVFDMQQQPEVSSHDTRNPIIMTEDPE